jgi:uncharacterized protein YdiU (UPF0061 family)
LAKHAPLLDFDNSYFRLPERFYSKQEPSPVTAPILIKFNWPLAAELGLNLQDVSDEYLAQIFAGNKIPIGADPIALAYAGHQFGGFNILGDGRAVLLGEVVAKDGSRYDIQLKGSGTTKYSRGGDGRAGLGPVLREYIVSEAMHRLGIPTTRSLAAVTSGDKIYRETLIEGAIVTRVAESHIRFGTFEYFAAKNDIIGLKILADYAIARHYPEVALERNPYLEFLRKVSKSQAYLIAKWMKIGFIHGVMNTDNMLVSGQTVDYGPCAFMDFYDPKAVYSSIDRIGRYRFENQPIIGRWNLARLAEALLPLIDTDTKKAVSLCEAVIAEFPELYQEYWLSGMRAKLGLELKLSEDSALIQKFLDILNAHQLDYTNSFSQLLKFADCETPPEFTDWAQKWQNRRAKEVINPAEMALLIRTHNPAFIPRNHRIEEVIFAASEFGDFVPFEKLVTVLANPYQDQPENTDYRNPPNDSEIVKATFCGT